VYSIDGPWTTEEEEELLKLYQLKPVLGLDDAYRFDGADGGVGIFGREEALEKIKQIRIIAYRGGKS
jgi:hypothetical protein